MAFYPALKSGFLYNWIMSSFHFYQPIDVRYGDLDPQGHVNNARYVTYLEHARVGYIRHLGLWDGSSYLELGFIIASIEVDFQAPILITDAVRVGVRIPRLGGKSLDMLYRVEHAVTGKLFGTGKTVLVGYDYRTGQSMELLEEWRESIAAFEDIPHRSL